MSVSLFLSDAFFYFHCKTNIHTAWICIIDVCKHNEDFLYPCMIYAQPALLCQYFQIYPEKKN